MKTIFTFLFSIIFIGTQCYAQTPGAVGPLTTIESTVAFQGYEESQAYVGQGEYQIYYDNIDGVLDKPFIILDGLDVEDTTKITDLYALGNFPSGNLFDNLRDTEGTDFIFLNFPTYDRAGETIKGGADYIERNALVLVNLIETIKAEMTGTPGFIVMGPSMGGLISRYALRYMEQQGIDHQTDLWIAMDAPIRGANVPISFQYTVNFFAERLDDADMTALRDAQLNSTASKQMLLDHYSAHLQSGEAYLQDTAIQLPTPHPFRTTFTAAMDAMGAPQQTRNIALVNGSTTGVMVESPGAVLIDGTIDPEGLGEADVELHFTPQAGVVNYNIANIDLLFYGSVIDHFDGVAESPSYTAGLDSAPGGKILFSSLFTDPPSAIEQSVIDALQLDAFSFIPSLSALDVDDQNWYATPTTRAESSFDNYLAVTDNQVHLELTEEGAAFLMDEVSSIYLGTSTVQALNDIRILNNPAKDFINIQLDTSVSYDEISMALYAVTGQKIQEMVFNNPQSLVSIPTPRSSGMYVLHISNGVSTSVKKVLVE